MRQSCRTCVLLLVGVAVCGCGPDKKERDLQLFVTNHVAKIKPIEKEAALASWNAAITGDANDYDLSSELTLQLRRIYSNPDEFAFLKALRASGDIRDPMLARQLDVLYNKYLTNQIEPALLEKIVALGTEIEKRFSTFRGVIDGENVTDNEIKKGDTIATNTVSTLSAIIDGFAVINEMMGNIYKVMEKNVVTILAVNDEMDAVRVKSEEIKFASEEQKMAAEEIVDTLALLFPARLDEVPLSYSQAKALAGREPKPFEVLKQEPAAGVGVLAGLGSPQKVKLSYWDPSDDAVKQKCEPKTRVRAKGQKTKGLSLDKALVGLEFREGVKGNEGEAQELMRRFGCQFETKLVYSRSLETGSRVLDAKFKGYYSKVEVNGRIKKVKKFKLVVQAKVAKSGNDYILLFSDNPDAPGNQLPLSSKSRAAKRENSSFRLFLRETATGRAAVGATVELHDGDAKSTVIASGKTNSEGQVDLQFRANGPGDLKLYAFKQAKDPASGELITQDATVEITSTTADRTWTSLGGRTFREKDGGGYRRTSGVGGASASSTAIASSNYSFKYIFDISQAMTALSLAQVQATALGLSVTQQAEIARIYANMLGIDPGNEAAAQLLGKSKLEPALGVGSAGKICESNGDPALQAKLAPGISGPEVKVGGAVLAKFDCGRSVLISPTGLAVLPKGWISGSGKLMANDGASLIANDGASLIANDGASLIANDGASLLANDGASLLANDGASLLPVSKLMSDHGAGIVSNHSGALIANDGASFNPLGDGTSLMPSTGR